MIKKTIIFSLISIFLFAYGSEVWAKHFFMMLNYDKGKITAIPDTFFISDGNLRPPVNKESNNNNISYWYQAINGDGNEIISSPIDIPTKMIAEHFADNGTITGEIVTLDNVDFSVRIPFEPKVAKIIILKKGIGYTSAAQQEFSAKVSDFKDETSNKDNVDGIFEAAASGVLHVVILGDGYTDGGGFVWDAEGIEIYAKKVDPFNRYNIVWHYNLEESSWKNQGCAFWTWTVGGPYLMCGNVKVKLNAKSVYSAYDEIVVISHVNVSRSTADIGWCDCARLNGGYARVNRKTGYRYRKVALHEMGHSVLRLNDEYEYDPPHEPACGNRNCCSKSDCNNCGCPSSCDATCFQKCSDDDHYRCSEKCKMKSVDDDFCERCKQLGKSCLDRY